MLSRRGLKREAVHLGCLLVILFLLGHAISTFEVRGTSMEPTLLDRQLVVVDTITTTWRPLRRGDVIVFRLPSSPRTDYVKRVVGLAGETIAIAQGLVWVNGQALSEPYVRERTRYTRAPIRVPDHAVFVLGDNRNSSSDSHLWGPVPVNYVVGRAWFAYRPLLAWSWLAGQAPTIVTATPA